MRESNISPAFGWWGRDDEFVTDVPPGKGDPVPKLRGCNAELFEVKVFDAKGNLKYTIPKKEIEEREKAKREGKNI